MEVKKFGKRDLLFIGVVLSIAAVFSVFPFFFQKEEGDTAVIRVNGEVTQVVPLDEDRSITVKNDYGTNVIEIRGGTVRISEADCPDKICADHASISKNGESIVCLPHKLIVEICKDGSLAEEDQEVDAVAE